MDARASLSHRLHRVCPHLDVLFAPRPLCLLSAAAPVLKCVAVCCSVLQCVAVCCSVLQCVAVRCSDTLFVVCLLSAAASVLQCVAVCCSVLQCVAVCCSVPHTLQHTVTQQYAVSEERADERMWCGER